MGDMGGERRDGGGPSWPPGGKEKSHQEGTPSWGQAHYPWGSRPSSGHTRCSTGLPSGLSNSEGWNHRPRGGEGLQNIPCTFASETHSEQEGAGPPRFVVQCVAGAHLPSPGRACSVLCSTEKCYPTSPREATARPAEVCVSGRPPPWHGGDREARRPAAQGLWEAGDSSLRPRGCALAGSHKELWRLGASMCWSRQNQNGIERLDGKTGRKEPAWKGSQEGTSEGRRPGEEETHTASRTPERRGHSSHSRDARAPLRAQRRHQPGQGSQGQVTRSGRDNQVGNPTPRGLPTGSALIPGRRADLKAESGGHLAAGPGGAAGALAAPPGGGGRRQAVTRPQQGCW